MFDVLAFQKSVVQLVALASGIANDKIQLVLDGKLPQITGTYCSIQLTNDATIGLPSPKYGVGSSANILDEKIQIATEFTLSINFFRKGAMQHANNMKTAAYRSDVQATLFSSKIGWLKFGPINNLTDWFSGEYEERAQGNLKLLVDHLDIHQVAEALSVDVSVLDGNTPATFYSHDTQLGEDLIAFENKPLN